MLHYALKPKGFLWLGSSETTGSSADLFMPEDKKHRFYSKKPASARPPLTFARRYQMPAEFISLQKTSIANEIAEGRLDARKQADQFLLERYGPASAEDKLETARLFR